MGNNEPGHGSDSSVNSSSSNATPTKPRKYFEDQFDNETVLLVFRKHPVVMRKGLIVSSFAVLIGPLYTLALTYLKPNDPPSLNLFFLSILASFVLAAIIFTPSWMSWHFSVFIVTDQRLIQITQKGFFNRSVVDMALRQIQMVNYEVAGLSETLLGFGTIMMQTLVGDLVIHDVHHPAKTQKKILEILRTEGVEASSSEMNQEVATD
jgi:signal transduction histidine kinase